MMTGDSLQRFIFEHAPIRGEIVHLDATWQAVLERREYPPRVRDVLGELMAAAALLKSKRVPPRLDLLLAPPSRQALEVLANSGALVDLIATGARLVTTLANEMKRRGTRLGLVSVCAQGGMGFAMVLER